MARKSLTQGRTNIVVVLQRGETVQEKLRRAGVDKWFAKLGPTNVAFFQEKNQENDKKRFEILKSRPTYGAQAAPLDKKHWKAYLLEFRLGSNVFLSKQPFPWHGFVSDCKIEIRR